MSDMKSYWLELQEWNKKAEKLLFSWKNISCRYIPDIWQPILISLSLPRNMGRMAWSQKLLQQNKKAKTLIFKKKNIWCSSWRLMAYSDSIVTCEAYEIYLMMCWQLELQERTWKSEKRLFYKKTYGVLHSWRFTAYNNSSVTWKAYGTNNPMYFDGWNAMENENGKKNYFPEKKNIPKNNICNVPRGLPLC